MTKCRSLSPSLPPFHRSLLPLASLITLLAVAIILPSRSLAFQLTRGSQRIATSLASSLASRSSSAFQRIPRHCHLSISSPATTTYNLALKMTATSSASCAAASTLASGNPLLQSWSSQPFNLPPFGLIAPVHFRPAFDTAMESHLADLRSIVDEEAESTFDNVIAPYDRAGAQLDKVGSVFGSEFYMKVSDNLCLLWQVILTIHLLFWVQLICRPLLQQEHRRTAEGAVRNEPHSEQA